jgi:single-strand DNA-binding protein
MLRIEALGNVGRDPEMRYTQSGKQVCSFSLASNKRWTDSATGEKREKTTWVKCVAWGKLAEVINQHVTKGDKLYVSGDPSAEAWTDNSGESRSTLTLTIRDFEFAGGSNGDGNSSNGASAPDQRSLDDEFAPPPRDPDDIPF